jgi:hypothetical protein
VAVVVAHLVTAVKVALVVEAQAELALIMALLEL